MAGKIQGITIELNGDTQGLDTALKSVTSQSVTLSNDLKKVNNLLKLDPGNAELVAQKQQILAQSVETTAQKLEILRNAQAQVKAQFESGTISREQYIAFQEELVRTEQRMGQLTSAQSAFQSEMDGTAGSTKTLTQTVSEQEKELAQLKAKYVEVAASQGADSDEARQLASQIESLSTELGQNRQKLSDAEKAADSFDHSMERAESGSKSLKETIADQKSELSDLKARYAEVAAAQGADSDEAKQLAAQIKSLSGELKSNQQRLSEAEDAADDLDETIDELGDSEQETEGKTNKLGNALKSGLAAGAKVAGAALKASIAAIGAAGTAALKFAKDSVQVGMTFDASVSQIGATLGYTVEQLSDSTSEASKNLQMLRDKAQEMGAATSFSATEAAEGLNILAMSGYDAETSCAMIGDVLNLAAAGSLSLADAAAYTSGAVKGFADDTKDAQYYTDLMAKGATLANTDVKALGEALSGGAATAASYGQNAEGLTLALLRMAEQGVTGTQATTSLNRAMADLYTATPAAAAALKELGVSAYDTSGNARDFNTVVDDLNAALADMSEEEANAYKNTIFTSNGLQAFNKMTVTSTDKVNEWADALANASGSAGAQAETMLDNLQGDITIFGSAMEGAKIVLSDSLTPALREFVQFGTSSVSTLTEAFKSGGLTGAIAALGPILEELIGKVSEMLPAVISVATELVTALASQLPTLLQAILPPLITGVQQVLTALVAQLPALFGIISDSLPVLIDAILTILPQLIQTGLQIIAQLALGIAQALPTLIPTIVDVVLQIVETLIDNIDLLIDASIQLIMGLAQGLINALPVLIEKIPTIVEKLVNALVENAPLLFDASIELIAALVTGILQNLPQLLVAAGKIVVTLVKGIGQYLGTLRKKAKELLSCIGDVIKGGLKTAVTWGKNIGSKIASGIGKAYKSVSQNMEKLGEAMYDANQKIKAQTAKAWESVKTSISQSVTTAKNNAVKIWDGLKSAVSSANSVIASQTKTAWDGLKNTVSNILTALKNTVKTAWDNIKAAISTVLNALSSLIPEKFNGIKTAITTIVNAIKSVIETVWNAIKSVISAVQNAISSDTMTIWEKIKSIISVALSAIQSIVSSVWNAIKTVISTVMDGISSVISSVWNTIKTTISTAMSTISSNISSVWENIKSAVSTKVTGIKNTIKTGFDNAVTYIKSLPAQAWQWGADIIDGIVRGIRAKIGEVTSAVSGVAEEIKSYLHFSVPDVGPLTDFPTWMPDMMKGLAQGIKQNMKYVENAVSNLASAMIPAVDLAPALAQYDASRLKLPDDTPSRPRPTGGAPSGYGGSGNTYNITIHVDRMDSDTDVRRTAEVMSEEIEQLKTDNNTRKGEWSV